MGRAFVTDMQMPRNFWYWALRQFVQVLNYILCMIEGVSTTPMNLSLGLNRIFVFCSVRSLLVFSAIFEMDPNLEAVSPIPKVCKELLLVTVENLMV